MRTSNGAQIRERLFLRRKRVGERVMSERRARVNVRRVRERPRMVRLK